MKKSFRIALLFMMIITPLLLYSCKSELPSVTTSPITAVTGTTAIGGGNVIDEGSYTVVQRGICWSTDASPRITSDTTNDGSGEGVFVSIITNLEPETDYHVRAFASNEAGIAYGNEEVFTTTKLGSPSGSQIIADHSIVDRFDDIPAQYIAEVKKMWLSTPGLSHSRAYIQGLALLEALNPTFDVSVQESGTPEANTTSHLRASNGTWGSYWYTTGWQYGSFGGGDWFGNPTGIQRTKDGISYCHNNNLTISAFALSWCWDMVNLTGTSAGIDPVYGVHWWGASVYGPEGDRAWGLDDADNAITGNSVNLDSYLEATQGYIDYCAANNIPTKIFFTTGTVDTYHGESAYQGYLKNERIRDYIEADADLILFDYADILCWDDNGTQTTEIWNGHTFPNITLTNEGAGTVGHISPAGALRLGKALWWMLARMAGWDGN